MIERAGGRRTVPQIFINGQHIGGCDELYALDARRQAGAAAAAGAGMSAAFKVACVQLNAARDHRAQYRRGHRR